MGFDRYTANVDDEPQKVFDTNDSDDEDGKAPLDFDAMMNSLTPYTSPDPEIAVSGEAFAPFEDVADDAESETEGQ